MPTLEQIRACLSGDRYAVEVTGVEIQDAGPGTSVCTLKLRPELLNANHKPMGGAIFTLADFAFAVASNQKGRDVVTQASQITFLKSAKGKHLTAVARQIKDGKRVCFYEITVSDELGTEVAFVTVNGYVVRSGGEG